MVNKLLGINPLKFLTPARHPAHYQHCRSGTITDCCSDDNLLDYYITISHHHCSRVSNTTLSSLIFPCCQAWLRHYLAVTACSCLSQSNQLRWLINWLETDRAWIFKFPISSITHPGPHLTFSSGARNPFPFMTSQAAYDPIHWWWW